MEKEVQVAIIGAIALILAATVGGFFNISSLFMNEQTENAPPVLTSFRPDKGSPQFIETKVNWTANAINSGNILYYSFYLKGPSNNYTWENVQDWRTQNWWIWAPTEPGDYTIEVKVSDGKNNGLYDSRDIDYLITGWEEPVGEEGWINKGVTLQNLGRYQEAIVAYDEAFKFNSSNADVWNKKSVCLGELGKDNESLECSSKATQLDPSMASGWFNKGVSLKKLSRYNESLEAIDEAIKLDGSAQNWAFKGLVLEDLKRHNESLTCCDMAIEIDPLYVNSYEFKGETLYSMCRYNESLEYHDKVTKLDPYYGYGLAWANKARALYMLGRYNESIESYDKALELNPSDLSYINDRESAKEELIKQTKSNQGLANGTQY